MDHVTIEVPAWFARILDMTGQIPWPIALAIGATFLALDVFTIQLEAEQRDLPPGTYFKRPIAAAAPPRMPEQLFESMKLSWN